MLIRLSQPSGLFVSLDDVKAHVIVDTTEDDELVKAYIRAATRFTEDRTGRILLPVDFELRGNSWCEPICIPVAPVREIAEVSYVDEQNVEQLLSASEWFGVVDGEGAEVRFTGEFTRPVLSDRPQAVRIRFSAGYDEPGSGDDSVLHQDAMDRLIVMMLVANWYETRESVALAETVEQIPFSVKSLIEMRRIFR